MNNQDMKKKNKKTLTESDGKIKKVAHAFVFSVLFICVFLACFEYIMSNDIVSTLLCIFILTFLICWVVAAFNDINYKVKNGEEEKNRLEAEKEKIQDMHRRRIVSEETLVPENDNVRNIINDTLISNEKFKARDLYNGPFDPKLMSDSYARGEVNEHGKIVRYKNGNGVEGIVEGREYNQIDSDNDGRILVSEFYPLTEEEVLEKILVVDTNFSKTQFKSFVRGIFMLIQKAWSNNDYHTLRAFEADSLYYEHKIRLEDLSRNGVYDKRENIGIKGVLLKDFKIEGDKEILVVALTARMDRNFNNDVFKNRDSSYYLSSSIGKSGGNVPYIMTFARNKGVKTKAGSALSTTNCYNCGAVIDVDDRGVCTYCNTSLVSGEVDWVLVDIKNIKLVEF